MPTAIPLSAPDITQREIDAVIEVMLTGTLSLGPKTEEFERLAAEVAGRRHAVAVSSGTAALHCALLAAGIGPGDEVITTPFSFVASTNCILYVGATPVFVDIDPKTLNLDVGRMEAAITPRTKAIVAVEVFGHPGGMCEIEQIARRHELILIEDGCEGFGGAILEQASGAAPRRRPIGSFGRAGVFAFSPTKQITSAEGGMVVTDDDAFAAACRSLRNQGRDSTARMSHDRLGYNYRLSEIHAAIGVVQCHRLEQIRERRRRVAHDYMTCLMDNRWLIVPTLDGNAQMSWFMFVVRLNDLFEAEERDQIIRLLAAEGIGCQSFFPPIHLQLHLAERFGHKPGAFPVCEYVSARTLALPFHTNMPRSHVYRVCEVLAKVLEKVLVAGKNRR